MSRPPTVDNYPTLIVGAGGLLGSAITRTVGHDALRAQVRWGSPDAARDLEVALGVLLGRVDDRPWRIFWCAGAGVVGTSEDALAAEVDQFETFLHTLVASAQGRPGTLFLASSAGGVLAGSGDTPPYTEYTTPAPLAPYGRAKLAMEEAARAILAGTCVRLAIGRIANLYGPGQNLTKMQGLISHLGRAVVTGAPLGIYVPIDTLRDYIYADDCAAMALGLVAALERTHTDVGIKLLASGQSLTIGELIGLIRDLEKRKPPVVYAASTLAAVQASDLRLRSVRFSELNGCVTTPLPVGISATLAGIRDAFCAGELTPPRS